MKKILLFLSLLICCIYANANDSLNYSVKYRYIKQIDSNNLLSKFDDIMILSINGNTSTYYSYLKQFGNRNYEKAINTKSIITSNNTVSIDGDAKENGNYFFLNEAEIIHLDFKIKAATISDKLITKTYSYTEKINQPVWKIGFLSDNILGQKCQMATTTFRGRNYIAWFAPSIPYPMGPWLFNGLPGLILKVSDDKKQFVFECIELNTPKSTTKVYKPYTDINLIDAKRLKAKKKLMAQNFIAFMQAEDGVTITMDGGQPVPIKIKPYNPIDLSDR